MKLTFPHMGNAYISIKVLLDSIGLDYFMPPVGSGKTMEYGVINSPEFMCLPFKTVIGDFIQGLENGADTILFGGGCGQCRLSYYGDLQQEILKSKGYKFNYIHLNLKDMSYNDILNKLKPVLNGISRFRVYHAVTRAAKTVFAVDRLYLLASRIRCRQKIPGSVDKVMNQFEKTVQTVRGYKKITAAIKKARMLLAEVETNKTNPIRIAIVGEIFIASDPFTNLQIERKLGNMGVEVINTISVSSWIRDHFIGNILPVGRKNKKSIQLAQEYIGIDDFGGHGIYSVGNSILASMEKYDGVIQVYPFTCMPEIIAQTAFGHIQTKYNIPIMTLILDEMTGEAGYMTRLEAFVDMIKMRKQKAEQERENNKAAGYSRA